MGEGAAESIMRGSEPESLFPTELQLDREPLARAPAERPVKALVRWLFN